jgi:hypothetical protein
MAFDDLLATEILGALQDWRFLHRRNFDGTVCLALVDVQAWDEEQQRHRNNGIYSKSRARVGDVGTIWGAPYRIDDRPAGTFVLEPKNV